MADKLSIESCNKRRRLNSNRPMGSTERYKSSKKVRQLVEALSPKRKNVDRSFSSSSTEAGEPILFCQLVSLSPDLAQDSEQAVTYDTLLAVKLYVKMDNELVCIEEEKEFNKLISDTDEYTKHWDFPLGSDRYIFDYRAKVK